MNSALSATPSLFSATIRHDSPQSIHLLASRTGFAMGSTRCRPSSVFSTTYKYQESSASNALRIWARLSSTVSSPSQGRPLPLTSMSVLPLQLELLRWGEAVVDLDQKPVEGDGETVVRRAPVDAERVVYGLLRFEWLSSEQPSGRVGRGRQAGFDQVAQTRVKYGADVAHVGLSGRRSAEAGGKPCRASRANRSGAGGRTACHSSRCRSPRNSRSAPPRQR